MANATRTGVRLVCLAAIAAVAACERVGDPFEALSQKQKGPDEFSVVSRAPLSMPGSRELPEPRPGVASRLDPNPQRAAIEALTGRGDSFATANAPAISPGEQVLLGSANASAETAEIRKLLETDAIEAEENKPYEPPTVLELLSGNEPAFDEEEVIDPNAESRRLQRTGVAVPVNPFERPPEPAAVETDESEG